MNDLVRSIKKTFRDKEYRHGYVDDFLNASIATQIKVLREQRGWNQKELADKAGMLQPRISVLENINYSSWSIKALRKIAEAFDLTLCVSFESFGKRARDIERFNRQSLERNSFNNDPYFQKFDDREAPASFLEAKYSRDTIKQTEEKGESNISWLYDHAQKKDQGSIPETPFTEEISGARSSL